MTGTVAVAVVAERCSWAVVLLRSKEKYRNLMGAVGGRGMGMVMDRTPPGGGGMGGMGVKRSQDAAFGPIGSPSTDRDEDEEDDVLDRRPKKDAAQKDKSKKRKKMNVD